mgnify:FL=1
MIMNIHNGLNSKYTRIITGASSKRVKSLSDSLPAIMFAMGGEKR